MTGSCRAGQARRERTSRRSRIAPEPRAGDQPATQCGIVAVPECSRESGAPSILRDVKSLAAWLERPLRLLTVTGLLLLSLRPPWVSLSQRQGLSEKAEPIGHHWIFGSDLPQEKGSTYVAQGYAIHWGALALEGVALLVGGLLLSKLIERKASRLRMPAESDDPRPSKLQQLEDDSADLRASNRPETATPGIAWSGAPSGLLKHPSRASSAGIPGLAAAGHELERKEVRVSRVLVLLGVLSVLCGVLRGEWLGQVIVWAFPLLIAGATWAILRLVRVYHRGFTAHFLRPVLVIQSLFLIGAVVNLALEHTALEEQEEEPDAFAALVDKADRMRQELAQQAPGPRPSAEEESWRQFSHEGAPECSVSMPGTPKVFTHEVVNEGYELVEHHAQVLFVDSRLRYGLSYFDLPVPADAIGEADARELLVLFKDGLLVKNDATQRTENSAPRAGFPCMDFLAIAGVSDSEKVLIHFRLYLAGNRVYQLSFAAPKTRTPNGYEEMFFNSFEINKNKSGGRRN